MAIRYERDVLAWSAEHAHFLRGGRLDPVEIDTGAGADEAEELGEAEQRELATRVAVLVARLLKWVLLPEWRSPGCERIITELREGIARRLARAPSLRACLDDPEWWHGAWSDARQATSVETGVAFDAFGETCPWSVDQVLGPWLPSSIRFSPAAQDQVDRGND